MISLHNQGSHIFPPTALKLYGSHDQQHWNLLKELHPEVPKKAFPVVGYSYQMNFSPGQYRYLKLESQSSQKLPDWHPQKGLPGWLFISELVIE